MRNLHALLVPSVLVVGLLACGGKPPPPTTTAAPAADHLTPAQHKLAHFRTPDGMVGLTLDRSGPKPVYQVDGHPEIIELTQKEQREKWAGRLDGYFFVAPDGKRAFFLDEGGGITYLPDTDKYTMMWDKDVPALGPATVTGTYVAPPPKWQATLDRLTAISVKTKFPQYKPEDSANLAKVAEVIAQATPDMFVHYASKGQTDYLPHLVLVPQSFTGISFGGVGYTGDDAWDPKAKGLAKFGGKNQGWSHYDTPRGNHMQVMTLHGYPPKLGDGTPGIVWEASSSHAVFVAFDGGRYDVDLSKSDVGQTLDAGAGPQSGWPAPAQDALLTVYDVSSLAKAGAVPQKAADDLFALDQDWTKCAAKSWDPAVKLIESDKHFSEADRKEYEKKARTACGSIIQKQEAMILQIVTARVKERTDLFNKAKTKAQ